MLLLEILEIRAHQTVLVYRVHPKKKNNKTTKDT